METRNCQNCKQDFTIEPDDFSFYEKIKVPPPTFCRKCRFIRRMAWRNERSLYRRICNLCNKNIISMYRPDVPFPVFCHECWWSDKWDPSEYGRDYDMSKPFFEQYKDFYNSVPHPAIWARNIINSEYTNMCGECKNVYLSCSVIKNSENIFYSKCVDSSKDIFDSLNVINTSESLYENVEAQGNYNSQHMLLCRSCLDSYFLVDCVNCSNCFMSYNLRNKKFYIRNQQYTKEDYFKELEKFDLKSRSGRAELIKEFEEIKKKAIYRFGNINKCVDVTGNNLLNVKNSKFCFEIYNMEDSKYCYRAFDNKECMDLDFGGWSELMYEYSTGAKGDYNVKFSYSAMESVRNADYTDSCRNCTNIFGCISLRDKENAIFNKVYSKDEFNELRVKIIEQMNSVPYIDKAGREYRYGEFFPIEISPFAYNETPAYEFAPLDKETVEKNGYRWKEQGVKDFQITMPPEKIPDNIDDVDSSILAEAIGCLHGGQCGHQCGTAFKITDYEFNFYKKQGIPLPNLCPNCRYYSRLTVMPGVDLYTRECMCDKTSHFHSENSCSNEFETSYAPERPEKVYCEQCYQAEVL